MAAESDSSDVAEILIRSGADVNSRDSVSTSTDYSFQQYVCYFNISAPPLHLISLFPKMAIVL